MVLVMDIILCGIYDKIIYTVLDVGRFSCAQKKSWVPSKQFCRALQLLAWSATRCSEDVHKAGLEGNWAPVKEPTCLHLQFNEFTLETLY